MNKERLIQLLIIAIDASVKAGEAILEIYNTDFDVSHKVDNSPLTQADMSSHQIIKKCLADTQLPLLSEEGKETDYETRKEWGAFWLVDPLDGTKEFVKKNGEFTVNIALINNHRPIMGIIYIPVKDEMYFACEGIGAYLISGFKAKGFNELPGEEMIQRAVRLPKVQSENTGKVKVVASRSHLSEETDAFINEIKHRYKEVELVSSGSSIKLCMIASGMADVYPRFAPTMEWDTAAGQAIIEQAGAEIIDKQTAKPMRYNKENLLNNWFIARRVGIYAEEN